MADIARVIGAAHIDHRLVGGQMVSLHVALSGASEPTPRMTLDADLGVESMTAADPGLPRALREAGFQCLNAANRFERIDGGGRMLVIDVLAPAPSVRLRPNRRHGDLVLDEIPGLRLAMSTPPLWVTLEVALADDEPLSFEVALPDIQSALCLKTLSWNSRLAARDAVDVWRLLRAIRLSRDRPLDWGDKGSQRDTVSVLQRDFTTPAGRGANAATGNPALRAEVRTLALWVLSSRIVNESSGG